MALIARGVSLCQVCGQIIREEDGDDVIGFSCVYVALDTPQWVAAFNDACAHRSCFMSWPKRREFIRLFNRCLRISPLPDGSICELGQDGEEHLTTKIRRRRGKR